MKLEHARDLAEEAEIAEVRRFESGNPLLRQDWTFSTIQKENAEDEVAKAALEKEQKVGTMKLQFLDDRYSEMFAMLHAGPCWEPRQETGNDDAGAG